MKLSLNQIVKCLTLVLMFGCCQMYGQESKRDQQIAKSKTFAQQAGKSLANGDFAQAEANYRRAVAADPDNSVANYNFGNLYYGKKLKNESSAQLGDASKSTEDKSLLHRIFHNQGNILMDKKQYAKAVEAYKNALRNDPTDDETRYNLAIAKEKLKKKQQQQKKNNKNKNKDNKNKNKDNQDQKNKNNKQNNKDQKKQGDKGKEDKKNKDDKKKGGNKEDEQKKDQGKQKQNQDKKEGDSKKDEQKKQQQGKPQKTKGRLTKQQAQNLLQAIQNQEEQTREKVNAKKTKGRPTNVEKDW